MEFVLIRPGEFAMGSDTAESDLEKPAHAVTITRSFYLGKFEVTQGQWEALMTRNESAFRATSAPTDNDAGLPVDTVNWYLCRSFLGKLSEAISDRTFRLPSEAEWEYAARAGASSDREVALDSLREHAWFGENANGTTHPVGTRKPNAWGLYDMYGNVW